MIPPTNRWFNPGKLVRQPFPAYYPGYAYPVQQTYPGYPAQQTYPPYQAYPGYLHPQVPQPPVQPGQPPVLP